MYKIDLKIIIHFYINALRFIVGLIITQFQLVFRIDILIIVIKANASLREAFYIIIFKVISKFIVIKKNIKKNVRNDIEVFILYDSFTFNIIQRKYFTYKRKLYAIITFYSKYNYLYKHFYYSIMIYINHKFFIHFLTSNLHENVYKH